MATNNVFTALTVPEDVGVGPDQDISTLAPGLSLIVDAPASSTGTISIEISGDFTNYSPATGVFPLHNPPDQLLKGLCGQSARVRRITGNGPATVGLASQITSYNKFANLHIDSVADTSEFGPYKTIIVSGEYEKQVVVEGSFDGTSYDAVCSFDTLDSDVKTVYGTWSNMRLRSTSDEPTRVAVTSGFSEKPLADHLLELLTLNDSELQAGTVVKIHGAGEFNQAKADSYANGLGTIGILSTHVATGDATIITDGRAPQVNMEANITPAPAAGDTLYLSTSVFGVATTVKPTATGVFSMKLGVVKDATEYQGGTGSVVADITMGEFLPAGPASGTLAYGEFSNSISGSETVTVGSAVPFDVVGTIFGGVVASTSTEFILPDIGVYQISWNVTFNEASQLILQQNPGSGYVDVANSVSMCPGVNARNSNTVILTTTAALTKIKVINPTGNTGTLTLTPATVNLAKAPVANLCIVRIG